MSEKRFAITTQTIRLIALLQCGAFHAAVDRPGDKTTPGKNDETDEPEDCTDNDEDRAFGEVGFKHVGCISCGGDRRGRIVEAAW